ncbi:MAG: GH32 C-terminal domain-containing protein [Eubacteriales bacterium]|nr:GH32 C-terminal domain-containing protein [Eubacteriales bacterium]
MTDARQSFIEWDRGFDFYAPQTFRDGKGRSILLGWAGMIDTYYGNERTVRRGWQHALTIPRELKLNQEKNIILQNPVKEMEALRKEPWIREGGGGKIRYISLEEGAPAVWEAIIVFSAPKEEKEIIMNGDLAFTFQDSVASLSFFNGGGEGRDFRKAHLGECKEVRILMDSSLIEIYLNGGEMVFTTRYYPGERRKGLEIVGERESLTIYPWRSFQYE